MNAKPIIFRKGEENGIVVERDYFENSIMIYLIVFGHNRISRSRNLKKTMMVLRMIFGLTTRHLI